MTPSAVLGGDPGDVVHRGLPLQVLERRWLRGRPQPGEERRGKEGKMVQTAL